MKKIFTICFFICVLLQGLLLAKKKKVKLFKFIPAPYGDFEVVFTKNLNIVGSIYGVKSDLAISNVSPVIFHKGIHILNDLASPYPIDGSPIKIKDVTDYIDIASGSIVFSGKKSGLYFGSNLNGLICSINSNSKDSILALRSSENIYITAGQNNASSYFNRIDTSLNISNPDQATISLKGNLMIQNKLFFKNESDWNENFWGIYVASHSPSKGLLDDKAPPGGDQEHNLGTFSGKSLRFRIGGEVYRKGIWKKRGFLIENVNSLPLFMLDGHGNLKLGSSGPNNQISLSSGGYIYENGNTVLPSGVIAPYKGNLNALPNGWVLCDGSQGTPDLRGLFIRGASQVTNKTLIQTSRANTSHHHNYNHPPMAIPLNHWHKHGLWGTTFNTQTSVPTSHIVGIKHNQSNAQQITFTNENSISQSHRHHFAVATAYVPQISYHGNTPYDPPNVTSASTTTLPMHHEFFLIMKV